MAGEVNEGDIEEKKKDVAKAFQQALEELADDLRYAGVDALLVDGVIKCEINGETHTITIEMCG